MKAILSKADIVVGSIIAAQAYPGDVCAMIPAEGFERVPPEQKKMRPDKFTIYLNKEAIHLSRDSFAWLQKTGRGLTRRRLATLTVVHNYDTPRHDGSTPAERLYGRQFPDLFEWLLGQIDALPLPRQSRLRATPNPLPIVAISSVAA